MAWQQESTPYPTTFTAGDQRSGTDDIDFIMWCSKTATAGDDLAIYDNAANVIIRGVADGPNYFMIFPLFRKIDKIKITTLDSGYITLFLHDQRKP